MASPDLVEGRVTRERYWAECRVARVEDTLDVLAVPGTAIAVADVLPPA